MLRLALTALVLVLALAVGSPPVFAKSPGGKVNDVAATRAYLLAWNRLGLAGRYEQQAGETAVRSLVANAESECSGVLAEAPESRARDDIRDEILEDVALTVERPARNATLIFTTVVQRLRWSNRKLTYYVSHSAREEAAKEKIVLPDICTDAKAFAADGFKAAPMTTEKFLTSCSAANSITTIEFRPGETGGLQEKILRLLKPYERPNEKALIPRKPTKLQLKRLASSFEKEFGTPVVEIAHALGLPE